MNDAQTMMVYDATKKSMLVSYVLWWFLGVFGAHRFYLGRTGTAVAMLAITLLSIPLTLIFIGFLGFAVIGVWWIIDAFMIPAIVREQNLKLASRLGGGGLSIMM
jgi:TM2 domain-containing membrane protein YozV